MSSRLDRWKSDSAKPLAQGGCHSSSSPPGSIVPAHHRHGLYLLSKQAKSGQWNQVQAQVNGKVKRLPSVNLLLNILFQVLIEETFFSATVLVQQCK